MSDGIPFIPNALDDHGLSPGEFRVFCHIARRGECFASIPSMARVCRMDAKTVKRAIKTLAEGGLLRREFRLGETLKLSVAPPGEWTPPRPKDTLGQKTPQGVKGSGEVGQKTPDHLGQKTPYKGPSSEDTSSKGPSERPRQRFQKPTIEQLKLHAAKLGLPEIEAERFFGHYESNGWRVGRNPMKSWHGAMATWKIKWQEGGFSNRRPAQSQTPKPLPFKPTF